MILVLRIEAWLMLPETLHQRIHAAEHELYPKCVAALARGEMEVAGGGWWGRRFNHG